MIYQEISKSFRSLMIHRLRTLLSTLGVLFGVVAVVTMLSIGEGAKKETMEQIAQLGMHTLIVRQNSLTEEQHIQAREKRSKGLTLEDGKALKNYIPALVNYAPLKIVEASLTGTLKEISPEILAVTRAFAELKQLSILEGRFICDTDSTQKQLTCVLGYDVAVSLGDRGHVGHTIRLENVEYQIVGILQTIHWKSSQNTQLSTRNLDKAIFIPLGTEKNLLHRLHLKEHLLSEIYLQVAPKASIYQTATLVHHVLHHTHEGNDDYQLVIPLALMEQMARTQRTFNLVLGSIAMISLLVGGIGIMNIMLATVSERTREIGIRRAVGANQTHILTQFLLETLLLTSIGAILGLFVGILCSLCISLIAGWPTVITFWSIFLSLLMSIGVGLCSGLYPAYKAASLHPLEALRYI